MTTRRSRCLLGSLEKQVIRNTIVTYQKENIIYDGKVYYNHRPDQDGNLKGIFFEVGSINLYEYNIDKVSGSNDFICRISQSNQQAQFELLGKFRIQTIVYGDSYWQLPHDC